MTKKGVPAYWAHLEENIFTLHQSLRDGTYQHDPYKPFFVYDPKRRWISEPTVKDRVVHQAIVQVIEPIFEQKFIFDSFSSRKDKGTHAGVERLEKFLHQATSNYRFRAFALKCDIKKFFDSVSHEKLLSIIGQVIDDQKLLALIQKIIGSYAVDSPKTRGLPLGNTTSQLFANLYLNAFDHFVKERLEIRWYVRFCDDFIIVHPSCAVLESILPLIQGFLRQERALELHSEKVFIRKFSQGIDFVGQVLRPHVRTLRTKTKQRLFRRVRERIGEYRQGLITDDEFRSSLQSCLGVLGHGANYKAEKQLREEVWGRLLG